VVPPDGEHTESAQEIEVARPLTVEQILPFTAFEPDIVSDRLKNPDELFVQMPLHISVDVLRVNKKACYGVFDSPQSKLVKSQGSPCCSLPDPPSAFWPAVAFFWPPV
jgi:hypothetical protein